MRCDAVLCGLWNARCAKDSVASSGIIRSMFIQHATNKMKTIKDKYYVQRTAQRQNEMLCDMFCARFTTSDEPRDTTNKSRECRVCC